MNRLSERAQTGALIGLLAGSFAILVSFLLGLRGVTFTPAAAGQAIIELLPGWLSIPLIELLHEWAKRLLVIGIVALFLACSAVAGMWAVDSRRSARAVATISVAPWLLSALAGVLLTAQVDLVTTVVNGAASVAVFLVALAWLSNTAQGLDAVPIAGRRRALMAIGGFSALVAIGGGFLGPTVRAATTKLGDVTFSARRLREKVHLSSEGPAFAAIPRLTPRITQNADHYVVDEALIKPVVDVATWKLDVMGHVENALSLSYEDLLDQESIEQVHTLECISNPVGGPLISTAIWTGVPLADLLAKARPRAGAFDVILRSTDNYSDSIPLAKAMEPHTIVAYLMNGRTVPQDHGFPARVLVPDIYGMKNVKWVRRIEVVTFDYSGYWQERGWADGASVNTNSRIDVPDGTTQWDGRSAIVVAGVAFSGTRGISKVELSTDDGKTWLAADLEAAPSPFAWRRWAVSWTPPAAGRHRLLARATDGAGNVETVIPRDSFPNGATGYDRVDITVVRA